MSARAKGGRPATSTRAAAASGIFPRRVGLGGTAPTAMKRCDRGRACRRRRHRRQQPGRDGDTCAPPEPPPLDATLERRAAADGCACPTSVGPPPKFLGHRPGPALGTRRSVRVLLSEEVAGRNRSSTATRLAAAGFPPAKPSTSGPLDQLHPRTPPRAALRTLEWVRRRENLVVCGPSGTARRCSSKPSDMTRQRGRRVAWFILETSRVLVRRHGADDSVTRASAASCAPTSLRRRTSGLLGVTADAAEGLYRLVDAGIRETQHRHHSNLHPSGFDEIMPKPSPVPPSTGYSTRPPLRHHRRQHPALAQATAGKVVMPLDLIPCGRSHGRHRGELVAITGKNSWTPAGRHSLPLTPTTSSHPIRRTRTPPRGCSSWPSAQADLVKLGRTDGPVDHLTSTANTQERQPSSGSGSREPPSVEPTSLLRWHGRGVGPLEDHRQRAGKQEEQREATATGQVDLRWRHPRSTRGWTTRLGQLPFIRRRHRQVARPAQQPCTC